MILYIHFNWYHYQDNDFRARLRQCNILYSVNKSPDFETILESDRYPFMRLDLAHEHTIEAVIQYISPAKIVKVTIYC
jgi:hypothetical protein